MNSPEDAPSMVAEPVDGAPDPDEPDDVLVPAAADVAVDAPAGRRRSGVRSLVEWGLVILGALVIALVIKTFLIQAFYIPSRSMEPTLKIGDRVLVNKLSYDVHDIHRGDIVVFERPPNEGPDEIKDLIKRVIGLPGDTVSAADGHVVINGRILDEPYLPAGVTTENLTTQTIPAGMVFVMGDNRGDSRDSRFFGPISEKLIVGRAFVRVWPINHMGFL